MIGIENEDKGKSTRTRTAGTGTGEVYISNIPIYFINKGSLQSKSITSVIVIIKKYNLFLLADIMRFSKIHNDLRNKKGNFFGFYERN